jgi:hypothetical protein
MATQIRNDTRGRVHNPVGQDPGAGSGEALSCKALHLPELEAALPLGQDGSPGMPFCRGSQGSPDALSFWSARAASNWGFPDSAVIGRLPAASPRLSRGDTCIQFDVGAISDVSGMRRLGVLQLVSRADASLGLELMGLVVPALVARRKFHFDADFSCTEIKCLYSAFCELAPLRGCERARVAQGGSDRN